MCESRRSLSRSLGLSLLAGLAGLAGLSVAMRQRADAAARSGIQAGGHAEARAKGPAAWANQLGTPLQILNRPVELRVTAISDHLVRISFAPIEPDGTVTPVADEPVLRRHDWPAPLVRWRDLPGPGATAITAKAGKLQVSFQSNPLTIVVKDETGSLVEQLKIDQDTGVVTFLLGSGPVLGLGEGGPQFDRRGSRYAMQSGQRVPDLLKDGARVPVPWLVGSTGNHRAWALFFHLPLGDFDLSGKEGRFTPWTSTLALPFDVFVAAEREPTQLLGDYASLTGHPQMPPLWSLGYQQSHRTLSSREEILSEARTFRREKLPCDLLIYLGTGFCPSGWNTGHGSFDFNKSVFPDPANMIRELHDEHFRVAVHIVGPPLDLYGTADDTGLTAEDPNDAANYWRQHLELIRLGIDGFWPDEGDPLGINARLARNRLYWDGPQIERPDQRPFALHRNGYAGAQRYAWLWSGDIHSNWETLAAQVPVGINTGLTGIPYWGTDTGGFIPTPEFTGELYTRWFQFSAFCPLFRSHGRTWKLRLPWGWNTGAYGPIEVESNQLPDPSELHNAQVEPICRKYLNLRYQLLPYTYTAARESHDTGLPLMRALWLYYKDDPQAAGRGDEYLWGREILVAPVTEKGATSRSLYLPAGKWYDFWTNQVEPGGREIKRPVDLATLPLYVRAGAIIPMGPVKQYAGERASGPLALEIYPGADGSYVLYEDDGETFEFGKGQFMRLRLDWSDRDRRLSLRLEPGSKMLPPLERKIEVRIPSKGLSRSLTFDGKAANVQF